ncbi:Histidine phosphatase superfamily, clade-2 [Penicillium griseofulvum]|uniref:Histidine phosphatase superfamily, clade-2 n=1 Tax=Penicillium patulum TaxID=5078 RepID=A0A135LEX7_PENPA|nr:Histidine phosphatase superfamily, clade-2 [Penicillium griseofulvum]KXG47485.1 Histidine phosphatase superfamily, clade-2 [Penicillium griseofulvum]
MLIYGLPIALLALQGPATVSAQDSDSTEKVWGVFAFTVHGDSKPSVLTSSRPLTDYGANELAAAASAFRYRYVSTPAGSATGIQNISPIILDSNDVDVLSTTGQNIVGSAQAFMQGLYPPLGSMNIPGNQIANGSFAQAPLNGYQYPRIVTVGEADPQSVLVEGHAMCDMYHAAEGEYRGSDEVQDITRDTEAFYRRLWKQALSGVYDWSSATYTNAVAISEYLDYEAVHNDSLLESLHDTDIIRARSLADQYLWRTNSQQSASSGSMIGVASPIAGQTLASSILEAFDLNVQESGTRQKMTLLFGGDEPAVALSSVMGLASQHQPNFYSRLVRGGSFVFELYSFEKRSNLYPSYPGIDNLYVRFLLHNGTDNTTDFQAYSLFGHSPSQAAIPYTEFRSELETFAVASTQEWCLRCNAQTVFCNGVLDQSGSQPWKKNKGMTPAVAGVIGAVTTLAVVGLTAIIAFLLCRARKGSPKKGSLGGFKGSGKLASDTDVTFGEPIWGNSKAEDTEPSNGLAAGVGVAVQGHERTGSWEMGQGKKRNENIQPDGVEMRSPFEDQEEDWHMHSGVQAVEARENV